MLKRDLIKLGCGVALIIAAFGGPATLAHYGVELPDLTVIHRVWPETKTPSQRVVDGFAHWTVKGDKDQSRVATLPIVPLQPELSPEVKAIVAAAPPFVGTCVSFLPPDYQACPAKPVMAKGQ